MASRDRDLPLPKFGEWDVNNPASAEGFTVIFSKARDEKKGAGAGAGAGASAAGNGAKSNARNNVSQGKNDVTKKKFCCF